MATEWKSQQSAGDYRLQFQTGDKKKYKFVEKAAQMAVDGKRTADVVEVVRCRNCIHFKTDTDYCKEHNRGYCEWDRTIKARKHYCSYGERKK